MRHHPIISAAEAIRPHLSTLLGEQAEPVKAAVDALLNQAKQGQEIESELLELLGKYPETSTWIKNKLAEENSVSKGITLSYNELPGERGPVSGAKYYKCPSCDYRWTKILDWQIPPNCPEDDSVLVEDN
jgi:hypothetical protein